MRRLKRWVGPLAFLALTAGCASQADPRPGLVGAWRSNVQFDTGMYAPVKDFQFLYVIHEDGTLTESSNYDAAPPVPPSYGVWRMTGPNEFQAEYVFFITAPSPPDQFKTGGGWVPSGHGVVREQITLSADGDSFTSKIQWEAFDKEGKSAPGGGAGTTRASRIEL